MVAKKKSLPAKIGKPTLFDVLANITFEKNDKWFNFSSGYNSYMITKYISMDNSLIQVADMVNRFDNGITKQMHYDFYRNILPKAKKYFAYVKKERNDEIQMIAEFYGISLQTAKKYSQILSSEQIEKIKEDKDKIRNSEW